MIIPLGFIPIKDLDVATANLLADKLPHEIAHHYSNGSKNII